MTVTQTGRAQYSVSSASNPDPNLVDLEAHGGVGECSCEDWKFRCYPNIRKSQILETELFVFKGPARTICKHGAVAMFMDYKIFTTERSRLFHREQI